MTGNNSHLDALENHSVFILREAHHGFKNMAMPWSMGQDSNVLLWLALKAFFGRSRADFVPRMGIVKEESDESLHWIDILIELGFVSPRLANEIISIVSSIETARNC